MTVNDIAMSNMAFRLPYKTEELRYLLANETMFKTIPNISIDNFIKHFFHRKDADVESKAEATSQASDSSSVENQVVQTNFDSFEVTSIGSAK